ncbi:MAG: IMP cyclohydrolase [Oscillospiraceae bacterium]|jgi:IMP cyclohydrolase|nr:IMP cyclohydrolase [Oscillospiraceae bacterium]
MKTAQTYLNGNTYPGRGLLIGLHSDGQNAVVAYFIMGRSENSRNRIFVKDGSGLRTTPYDASKMTDPSLVIYSPVRILGNHVIVSNGDQTDTIYEYLQANKSFEQALRSRTYEPDAPNYTPRISGMLVKKPRHTFTYKLSILKASESAQKVCQRFFYEYEEPVVGEGHLIHTYMRDGNPVIPSFVGEPVRVAISGSVDAYTRTLWNALNHENKVALFVRYINLITGETQTKIENKLREF